MKVLPPTNILFTWYSLWYELALEQRMVGQKTKYEASLLLWGVPAKRDGVLSDTNLQ